MLSYWEQQSFTHYRYAVIGGGLVGLSTALSLREMDPEASIVVLERGIIPRGASSRNAGFACFGSLTELAVDLDTLGEEEARQLVEDRWRGLEMLRNRIGDDRLKYENHGGYELLFRENMECLERMEQINQLLHPVFGQRVFSISHKLAADFGFNQDRITALIVNPLEGQLHTGAMLKSLIQLATAQGIDYLTGANTEAFEIADQQVKLWVSNGNVFDGGKISSEKSPANRSILFHANKIAICTNAFTRQLLPGLDLKPGRGQVLVTEEIPGLKFKGVFHYDEGYYYFRNVGNRVLFGGGRNLDFETESTDEFGINKHIEEHLLRELSEMILPGTGFRLASQWSGIMAFGEDRKPLVGLQGPMVGYAVRLGGMGVALGSMVGNRLAGLLCLNDENA